MDLEEWDLLSDDGFFDQNKDDIGDNFCLKSIQNTTTIIDMNYFQKFDEPQEKSEEIPEEVTKFPIETVKTDYQETVSQIFFKKLKENEFADMKMDSPKSLNMGNLPQIDVGTYQFEELEKKSVDCEENESQLEELSIINKEEKIKIGDEVSGDCDDDKVEGLNIWKWAMTGIGALFSFGFAAATVSFIVLGNHHKGSSCNTNKQEIHFQIFSHDKRMKQMVHRATKLNEAITVIRGGPGTRAHITIGGYYEGL
ncbi:uncharacterized protein LOC130808861 [Amaranthus tricolor]|uniref:uncharacterized protein LOC130808861 n=1 Tax=Amaranthus tricolor TaxID=29722 RepID=UPI002589A303|nr:uncharacterized protein LOC130808861 [Amaranthus tricolor]